jgi:hypothetical protein
MRFTLLFALALTTSLNAQLRRVEHKWIEVTRETFALDPGETKNMDISGEGRFRVEVSAASPVAFGIVSKSQLDSAENNRVFFDEAPCSAVDVLKTSKECDTPTGEKWLTVFDRRGTTDKLLARVMVSSAKESKITVSVYRWTCIANCASLPEKQKPDRAAERE